MFGILRYASYLHIFSQSVVKITLYKQYCNMDLLLSGDLIKVTIILKRKLHV